jgi:hypothetical protein
MLHAFANEVSKVVQAESGGELDVSLSLGADCALAPPPTAASSQPPTARPATVRSLHMTPRGVPLAGQ